mmetsp:Transcript_16668/g.21379  ORF Transcript_16668/g.21379 Transcript_16668/m.21379 type:complete len:564 (+) Transcript_16668:24-1715(+)
MAGSWDSTSKLTTFEDSTYTGTALSDLRTEFTTPFKGDIQQAKALFEAVNVQQKQDFLYKDIDALKTKNSELRESLHQLEDDFKTEIEDRQKIIEHLQQQNNSFVDRASKLQAQLHQHKEQSKAKYDKMETNLTRKVHDLRESLLLKEVELKQVKLFAEQRDEWKAEMDKLKEQNVLLKNEFDAKAELMEKNFNRTEKKILDDAKEQVKVETEAIKLRLEREMDEESMRIRQSSRKYEFELGYQGTQIQTVLEENGQLKADNEKLKMELKDSNEMKDLMAKKITYLERSLRRLQESSMEMKHRLESEEESESNLEKCNEISLPSQLSPRTPSSIKSAMCHRSSQQDSSLFQAGGTRHTSPIPPMKHRVGRAVVHRRKMMRPATASASSKVQAFRSSFTSQPARQRFVKTAPNSRRPTRECIEESVNTFGTLTTATSPRPAPPSAPLVGVGDGTVASRFEEFSQVTMPLDGIESLETYDHQSRESRTPSCALRDRIEELHLHLDERKKVESLHWAKTQLQAAVRQNSGRSFSSASHRRPESTRTTKRRPASTTRRPATASQFVF